MSALAEISVTEAHLKVSKSAAGLPTIDIKEGDWQVYLQWIAQAALDLELTDYFGGIIKYKRMCALAYLGRRAQHHGGVCSQSHARILTAQYVAEMAEKNKTQRFIRYPWLEKLLNLMAEIERIQDEISNERNNVISLVPSAK